MDESAMHDKNEAVSLQEKITSQAQPALNRWWKLLPGYALALAGLLWVLHDFQFSALREQLLHLKWKYVALALLCDVLGYFCQGWRWQLLLRNLGDISVRRATQALLTGLFVSEVMPLSLGELARSYLAARWMNRRFAMVFPSVLIERLFDGVWITVALGLTALFVPLSEDLMIVGDVLGALVLLGVVALIWFFLRQPDFIPTSSPLLQSRSRLMRPVISFLLQLKEGLRLIGFRRGFYYSFAVSLLFLLLQALAFWLMMWGYGLQYSFWVGAAVLIIVLIGTMLPGPPGNLGTYQVSCVVGLTLFGVSKSLATGFSLVVFAVLTVPLWLLGFLALSRSGTTLLHLRREVSGATIYD